MTIHTPLDLADAAESEEAAIAAARAELREPPACTEGCKCQCNKTTCACFDVRRPPRYEPIPDDDPEAAILRSLIALTNNTKES